MRSIGGDLCVGAILVACFSFCGFTDASDYPLVSDIQEPLAPRDLEVCRNDKKILDEKHKELREMHEACLAKYRKSEKPSFAYAFPRVPDACAVMQCQGIHVASEKFNKDIADRFRVCIEQVGLYKKNPDISTDLTLDEAGLFVLSKVDERLKHVETINDLHGMAKECGRLRKGTPAEAACVDKVRSATMQLSEAGIDITKAMHGTAGFDPAVKAIIQSAIWAVGQAANKSLHVLHDTSNRVNNMAVDNGDSGAVTVSCQLVGSGADQSWTCMDGSSGQKQPEQSTTTASSNAKTPAAMNPPKKYDVNNLGLADLQAELNSASSNAATTRAGYDQQLASVSSPQLADVDAIVRDSQAQADARASAISGWSNLTYGAATGNSDVMAQGIGGVTGHLTGDVDLGKRVGDAVSEATKIRNGGSGYAAGETATGGCVPLPPRCARASENAQRILSSLPEGGGISTAGGSAYCSLLVGIDANQICADEYRSMGRASCAAQVDAQVASYKSQLSGTAASISQSAVQSYRTSCRVR